MTTLTVTADEINSGVAYSEGLGSSRSVQDVINATEVSKFISAPVDFDWPSGLPTVTAYRAGDGFQSSVTPEDLIDVASFSNVYYVDIETGSSGNTGASWSSPLDAIGRAIDNAITDAVPTKIFVKGGVYPRFDSINHTGTIKNTTAPIAIIGCYGRVETGPFETLNWTQNATYSNVYQVNRSQAQQVVNPQLKDQYGEYLRYEHVADLATCAANAGTWFTDNTVCYVHAHNSASISDVNARVYLQAKAAEFSGNHDIYMCNLDITGGSGSPLRISGGSTNYVVTERCSFKRGYLGTQASGLTGLNGCTILGCGLFAAFESEASINGKDGFNLTAEGAVKPAGLFVNSKGNYNGAWLYNQASCNGFTTHDGIRSISIGCEALGNVGTSFGHVDDDTQVWAVGVTAGDSDGDALAGGPITFGGFGLWSTTSGKMWLEYCHDVGARIGVYNAGGTVTLNNHRGVGERVGV